MTKSKISKDEKLTKNQTKNLKKPNFWTKEEDKILLQNVERFNFKNWNLIASYIKGRTAIQCSARYKRIKPGIKKGYWTKEEDIKLKNLYNIFGKNWSKISKLMPERTGKQIRDHFLNSLDENLNKNQFSKEEDLKIISLFKIYGNSWVKIAKKFNGRTGDMVKNRYYSSLKKIIENDISFKKGKRKTNFLKKKRGRKSKKIKFDAKIDNISNNIKKINNIDLNNKNCFCNINKSDDDDEEKNTNESSDKSLDFEIFKKENFIKNINNNELSKLNNINNNKNYIKNKVFNPIVEKTININTLIIIPLNNGNFKDEKVKVLDNNINKSIINNNKFNIGNNIIIKNNNENNNFNETLVNDSKSSIYNHKKNNNSILKKAKIHNININKSIIEPQKILYFKNLIKEQIICGIDNNNLLSQIRILNYFRNITNEKINILNNK